MRNYSPIFGVVEGFYGVFYTFPQRIDLIKFIGEHGYNAYLYAPKNDRQHRVRWWEAYPLRIMDQFAATVNAANKAGIIFGYGISPGQSICYSSDADFERLALKLQQFREIGVCSFSILLDDVEPDFQNVADRQKYSTITLAQADLANRLYGWLIKDNSEISLSFCPVDYHGTAPFNPALHQLGAALDPAIDVFYTGPEIISSKIDEEDVLSYACAVQRPPLIWDNYPVNDLSKASELHLEPIQGRAPGIKNAARGIYINPMIQPEATKIPLLTYAAWWTSSRYEPDQAWQKALQIIAGDDHADCIRLFCNHAVSSIWSPPRDESLQQLVQNALLDLKDGTAVNESSHIRTLETYLESIDEACYQIKFRIDNLALRNDLLSWIEVLEHWIWMTRRALAALRSLETGERNIIALNSMLEYRELIQRHHRRVPADALMLIVDYTLKQDNNLVMRQEKEKQTLSIRFPRLTLPRLTMKKTGKSA
jgi:hyaluronoglucosaminidase